MTGRLRGHSWVKRRGGGPADGMVTAELAVALPSLALVLAGCLSVLGAVLLQLRCTDLADVAARYAARSPTVLTGTLPVADLGGSLPSDATVTLNRDGGWVTAQVRDSWRVPLLGGVLPPVVVSGAATMPAEQPLGSDVIDGTGSLDSGAAARRTGGPG